MEGVLRQPLSFRSCRENQSPLYIMHEITYLVNFKRTRIYIWASKLRFDIPGDLDNSCANGGI